MLSSNNIGDFREKDVMGGFCAQKSDLFLGKTALFPRWA